MGTPSSARPAGFNQAIIAGALVAEPEHRVLPSGTRALSFSLTVRVPGVSTTSVPMVWYDPPARPKKWAVGAEVVAVGAVTRRFFRGGAGLGSSTEVVVGAAQLRRHGAKVEAMLAASSADVGSLAAEVESA